MLFSRYGADMGIVIISPIYGSFARSETSILALVGGGLTVENCPRFCRLSWRKFVIKESCKMDHDLLMMVYGALVGAGTRVISSMVESSFQLWLEHRNQERQASKEQNRRVTQIYLPTAEEVRAITSHRYQEHQATAPRKAVGTGSIVLSVVGGGLLIHQVGEPMLSLGFGAMVSYLITNSILKLLRK
jgi:hypothetical protein